MTFVCIGNPAQGERMLSWTWSLEHRVPPNRLGKADILVKNYIPFKKAAKEETIPYALSNLGLLRGTPWELV